MPDYKINKPEKIVVTDTRPDFDGACRSAGLLARNLFGIDEYGNTEIVDGYERSRCSMNIKFVSYMQVSGMVGQNHFYEFEAWIDGEEE